MTHTHHTKPLPGLQDHARAARQQALRRAVRQLTLRHIGLCILLSLLCLALAATSPSGLAS